MSQRLDEEPLLEHTGWVVRGHGQGTRLGFPTANLDFFRKDIIGTYAGEIIVGEAVYQGAVYVDQTRRVMESYLFDFTDSLYDRVITVRLLSQIAQPLSLTTPQALKEKIESDVRAVQAYFQA